MTQAQLSGFLDETYRSEQPLAGAVGSSFEGMIRRDVEIADARPLQAAAASEAAFFAGHGFVLLSHVTQVRDWSSDLAVYLPELEKVIRERLLPGQRIETRLYPQLLRRGRDTAVPFYAEGVHSDGGEGVDEYAHNIAAFAGEPVGQWWRAQYGREEVAGLIWIDFWRVTNMAAPLEHMPLALCDVSTLDAADLVPTRLTGIAPEGRESRHLSLRFNPGQRWYYYPRMTSDEMLAFKLAEFWKDRSGPGNCFHSAFRDPAAGADAEHRQSCEYRAEVLILRD